MFRLFETLGYLLGAFLLLYLARLMARRRVRRPGEGPLFALVLATAVFHAGNFLAAGTTLLAGRRLPAVAAPAELVAFACLALLPPVLLHTHLLLTAEALAGGPLAHVAGQLARARVPLLAATYLPLALLPAALVRLVASPETEALAKLAAFERPFVAWIAAALAVCAGADFLIARSSPWPAASRLFRAVGSAFLANAALFVATFLLGLRRLPGIGPALVSLSMLSSIVPALVFAYFVYRYNYLGLMVRRGVLVALGAALAAFCYIFVLRAISGQLEELYGIDSRLVDAVLLLLLVLAALPFAGAIRAFVLRVAFPEVARQQDLGRELGESLFAAGTRQAVVTRLVGALESAFGFDRVELFFEDHPDAGVVFRAAGRRAAPLVSDEASDPAVRAVLEERGLACLVPVRRSAAAPTLAVLGVGRASQWPITTSHDAAPLVPLAVLVADALDHAEVVERNVALERRLQQETHLATLGRLAATVAHEVKNPLGAIKAIVQVMREQDADATRRADLDVIVSEVDRLAGTVNRLLAFSRLRDASAEAGVAIHDSEEGGHGAEPAAAAERVGSLFRAEAAANRATLQIDLGDLPARGARIPTLGTEALTEVLSNLVLNALQAGAARVTLRMRVPPAGESGPRFEISVEDDGTGIRPEVQARMFEPFFTTRQRGTGLGLAIVRRRIEMAGGTISCRSPLDGGRGTRFTIELPLHTGDERKPE